MRNAKRVAMIGGIVAITTGVSNSTEAKLNRENRINDNTESIRGEVAKNFLINENQDTIDFKREYIYQELDTQLYDFLVKKGANKLVKYYGKEGFNDRVELMEKTIMEHLDAYCNMDKNGIIVSLNEESKTLSNLYDIIFSEYFQYIETKINSEIRKIVKEKRLKKLSDTFGQKWTEEFLFEITKEIVQNPEEYGKFDNEGKYSLFDDNGNLFKKKEVQQLRKKRTDLAKLLQSVYGIFLMFAVAIMTRIGNTD